MITPLMPSLTNSQFRITKDELRTPAATMPFIEHLAKSYGFNIVEEWQDFTGIKPKLRDTKHKVESYLAAAEKYANVSKTVVMSKSKKREIVQVRQLIIFIAEKNGDGSFKQIAKCLGIDRTTCYHAIDTMNDLIDSKDKLFMPTYEALKHLIKE